MTSRRERLKQTFDWRLWLSLSLLILVIFIMASAISNARDVRAKDASLRHEQAQAATDRVLAAKNYDALRAYSLAQAQQMADLVKWLQGHKFPIPHRFLVPVPVPKIITRIGGGAGGTPSPAHGRTPPSNLGGGPIHGKGHPKHSTGHHKGHEPR